MNGLYMSDDTVLFAYIIFFATGMLITLITLPRLSQMILSAGFVRKNYCGYDIPLGLGLVFFLSLILTLTLFYLFLPDPMQSNSLVFLLGIAVFCLLGLVDDVWGSRESSGLKGHFKALLAKGELTTGALKALAGGVAALFLAAALAGSPAQWPLILLNALIIALSVNTINLLDLRPGRAGKAFILLSLTLLCLGWLKSELVFMLIIAGSLTAYMPFDLKARSMMGDTGANVLGATLGITSLWVLSHPQKIIYFALLVLIHVYAEKYSITRTISRNKLLNYIDNLGRDKIN